MSDYEGTETHDRSYRPRNRDYLRKSAPNPQSCLSKAATIKGGALRIPAGARG